MSQSTVPASDGDPFEVDEVYASLFEDLEPKQYKSLKASIREHGVDTAIIIDAENKVIDGHHRLRAVRELRAEGHDIPDIPFVQKPARLDTLRARRANLARRDGHKKKGVQDYLREHLPEPPEAADTDAEVMWPDDDDAWTQQGIAHELGVSRRTVKMAIEESAHIVRSNTLSNPQKSEQKRDAVRSYIENNPDATDAEVAEGVDWDISRQTVNRYRNQMIDDEEDEEDSTAQTSLVGAGDDAEETGEIAQDAADGEETASETMAEEGTPTPESATRTRDEKEMQKQIEEDEQRREEQRESFEQAVAAEEAVEVHHGDFATVLGEYEGESIDHIVTDPPYDEDALSLWRQLATVAERVLKPGGLVIAYSGQAFLPDVFETLGGGLEYLWQFVVTHEQPNYFIKHDIGIKYKPVLVFGKPPVGRPGRQMHDVIDGGEMEKEDHEWQQPVIEASELIEGLTEPDQTVCDPMCGSGTFGVAALRSDRRAVLIDVDEEAVAKTRERVSEVVLDE
jgi:16S rRNA G966 N2-methylase RsmD